MPEDAVRAPGAQIAQRSWSSELRVLAAVAWKEWLLFRRYPSWIMALLIWPLLFPLMYIFTARALSGPHGVALSTFARKAGTADYVSFIVVGTVLWQWLNITLWDMGFFLRNEQKRGTLESSWLCPVWRLSIMLGASFTKLSTSLLFLALTVLEFGLFLGVHLVKGNVALLGLIFLLMLPIIYGIGLVFGSLVIRFREADAMVFLVRGIFMVFCGIAYPLAVLPHWMKGIAYILPLTYAIRDVRAAVLADSGIVALAPDLARLAAFAVLLPALGVITFHLAERRARRTGTLGQY